MAKKEIQVDLIECAKMNRNEAIKLLKNAKSRVSDEFHKPGDPSSRFSIALHIYESAINEALALLKQKGPVEKCKWTAVYYEGSQQGWKTACGVYRLCCEAFCPNCGRKTEPVEVEIEE